MSRYRFELATTADDAELRAVLAATPMPGAISVAFEREPSYFGAAAVDGRFRQTMVVRDASTGRIVGMGSRSIGLRYVNGRPTSIGYLSNLRLLPEHRRQGLLPRGYHFLRSLHDDRRTSLYLTTIAEGNVEAITALTAGRAGLPSYHSFGRYRTVAIPLTRRPRGSRSRPAVEIRPARESDLAPLLELLHECGAHRQFFPCYEANDFFTAEGALRGLGAGDLLLAFDRGRLVGTLAAWDQNSFRQNVIHGYSGYLHWVRPAYNVCARLRRLPCLPEPGEPLRCLLATMPLVLKDDPVVLDALLGALLEQRRGGVWDHLLIGMHESDPLLSVLQKYPARSYNTQLYLVCWEDGEPLHRSLDDRPVYLELGSL